MRKVHATCLMCEREEELEETDPRLQGEEYQEAIRRGDEFVFVCPPCLITTEEKSRNEII